MAVPGREQHIKEHCQERKIAKEAENKRENLKIDSSYIGMESGRTYESCSTRKLSFRVQMGSTNKESQIGSGSEYGEHILNQEGDMEKKTPSGKNDTKNQENTDTENQVLGLEEAIAKLNQGSAIRNISKVNTANEYSALENIRQQCILYLWTIFFGESRAKEIADKLGISRYEGQESAVTQKTDFMSSEGFWQGSSNITGNATPLQNFTKTAFTITAEQETLYMESENTSFSTTGIVKTADGREISFQLDVSMSRSFVEYSKTTVQNVASFIDPLVINLNGNIARVSDQKFYFDLDADGEEELISRLCEDSGYLALDKNEDGVINDGKELFGTKSGDGFGDLSQYDEDGNGWIDENDDIWNKLKIWVQDEQGNSKLYSLAQQGVGAICLKNTSTEFYQRENQGEISAAIRSTGIFLYENGNVGTIQHLDLARRSLAAYA